MPAQTGRIAMSPVPGPLYLPVYNDDNSRKRQSLMLSQGLFDAFFDRLVLRIPRHLVVFRVLLYFRAAGRGCLLYRRLVGVDPLLWRLLDPKEDRTR